MTTVLVAGAIANKPFNGGASWTRLSWLLGLKALGFRVVFIEQIGRETCRDASGAVTSFEASENLRYFRAVATQMNLQDSMSLIYERGEQTEGAALPELIDAAATARFLVNISGHLTLEPIVKRVRRKVFIDLDPGFTQFWYAEGKAASTHLAGHDFYYTVGENIGRDGCTIPTSGIPWRPIRQPVVVEDWPQCPALTPGRFTTVGTWRGPFGPVEYGGKRFGLKVHQFRKFVGLPARVPAAFEIALDIHPADVKDSAELNANGWRVVDPRTTVADPASFRQYVQTSGAEFSTAQGVYVETLSGWFSDRTVRYLASGRPVLVQDTGFSRNYPVGEGLVPFRTFDEAVDGAHDILKRYAHHAAAARALAEEHFASHKVLGRLVAEIDS